MKKLFLLSSILALQTITAQAQQEIYKWRAGLHGGGMYSVNDIASTPGFGKNDFVYGLSLERSFNNAWSGKLLLTKGQFTVNDRLVEKSAQFGRSLNAQTRIIDAALMATYAFDNERNLSLTEPIAPYISAGLGLSTFEVWGDLYYGNKQLYHYWDDNTIHTASKASNPQAETVKQDGEFETKLTGLYTENENYPTLILNIPIALGVKFRLSDQVNLNVEAMTRFTNSDYLDDVSDKFRTNFGTDPNADLILAAKPNTFYTGVRGDKTTQDIYGSLMVSLHYNFGLKTPIPDINVPIVFGQTDTAKSIQPLAIGKPKNTFGQDSSKTQPIQMANTKTGARGGFTDFTSQYPLTNSFKTKDTASAAIADIERMRLEVGYISKELTQLDTTKDNTKLVSDRFARMTNIRTKVNDYRKYAIGSPEEQERLKTVLGDLQTERKDVVVSINMLMISTSDKSKIVDNLKKKEADNDGFIKRQEKRINELRAENGLAAIDLNAFATAQKTAPTVPKPEAVKTAPPVAVAEPKKPEQPAKAPDTRGAGGAGEVKAAPKQAETPVAAVAPTSAKTADEILKQKEAEFEKKMKDREIELQEQMAKREREMKEEMAKREREMQAEMAKREREMQAEMDRKLKEREKQLEEKYGKTSEEAKAIQELAKLKADKERLEREAAAAREAENARIAEEERQADEARRIAAANNKPAPTVVKTAAATPKKVTAVEKQLAATKAVIAAKEAEKAKKQSASATPNNQIWFIPNDSQLTSTQQARLKTVIAFLQANPEMTIELKPFIEPGMKDPDLPYTRADAVKNFLIMQGNIDLSRIQVALAGTGAIQVGKRWVSGRRIDVRYIVQ